MSADASIADVLEGRARWCVVHGDCLDVMPTMPDKSVAHVITDPPYESEAHTQGRRIKTVGGGGHYGETGGCVLDFAPITESERRATAREASRLARRWSAVFCQVEAVARWRDTMVEHGASYRRTCAFVKSDAQPQLSGDRPGMGYESIVCCHAPGRSRWNGGGRRGVFESARASTIECRSAYHMTEKPLPLMLELVGLFTDADEIVLDPFAGSGTTGVACLRLGRRCILIEKDATYAALARERMEAESKGLTLRAARAGQLSLLEAKP